MPIYCFLSFEVDTERFELRRSGAVVKVETRVFRLLEYLVRNRDRALTREELLRNLWPDVTVTSNSITHAIMEARKALGDKPTEPIIVTVRSRGYRFVPEVVEIRSSSGAPSTSPASIGTPAPSPRASAAAGAPPLDEGLRPSLPRAVRPCPVPLPHDEAQAVMAQTLSAPVPADGQSCRRCRVTRACASRRAIRRLARRRARRPNASMRF